MFCFYFFLNDKTYLLCCYCCCFLGYLRLLLILTAVFTPISLIALICVLVIYCRRKKHLHILSQKLRGKSKNSSKHIEQSPSPHRRIVGYPAAHPVAHPAAHKYPAYIGSDRDIYHDSSVEGETTYPTKLSPAHQLNRVSNKRAVLYHMIVNPDQKAEYSEDVPDCQSKSVTV